MDMVVFITFNRMEFYYIQRLNHFNRNPAKQIVYKKTQLFFYIQFAVIMAHLNVLQYERAKISLYFHYVEDIKIKSQGMYRLYRVSYRAKMVMLLLNVIAAGVYGYLYCNVKLSKRHDDILYQSHVTIGNVCIYVLNEIFKVR